MLMPQIPRHVDVKAMAMLMYSTMSMPCRCHAVNVFYHVYVMVLAMSMPQMPTERSSMTSRGSHCCLFGALIESSCTTCMVKRPFSLQIDSCHLLSWRPAWQGAGRMLPNFCTSARRMSPTCRCPFSAATMDGRIEVASKNDITSFYR